MQSTKNNSFCRRNFTAMLAVAFLIFGTSLHVPIAEALCHQTNETCDIHTDFTFETDESIEESDEKLSTQLSQIQAAIRKSSIHSIQAMQGLVFELRALTQVHSFVPPAQNRRDILHATGRLHSILPS